MIDMRSRKIVRKINDVLGKGLSGVWVVVFFFLMVFINLLLNLNFLIIIIIMEMKVCFILRNVFCNKKGEFFILFIKL